MKILKTTTRFEHSYKRFVKKNKSLGIKIRRVLNIFIKNPTHPGLNLEKLGKSNIWSIRIDRGNRIFLRWESKRAVILVDIGSHDKYRRF